MHYSYIDSIYLSKDEAISILSTTVLLKQLLLMQSKLKITQASDQAEDVVQQSDDLFAALLLASRGRVWCSDMNVTRYNCFVYYRNILCHQNQYLAHYWSPLNDFHYIKI